MTQILKQHKSGVMALVAATLTLTCAYRVHAQEAASTQVTTVAPTMSSNTSGITIPKLPTNVVVFPPAVAAADGSVTAAPTPAARKAQEIVTRALQKWLSKGGVGVVVYSSRLASILRAESEGQIKPDVAAAGPGDNPKTAQELAGIIGAEEYITVTIDTYAYDPATRRASFNLTVERKAADGTNIASAAEKAVGEAPADVARPRQEESAVARAAEVAAEQSVKDIYPQSANVLNPPAPTEVKKKRRSPLGWLIPVVTLGGILVAPR